MDTNPQQIPPEQKPTPSIDELISKTSSEVYAFQQGKQKKSLKQWITSLPKTQKILFGTGVGFVVFLVIVVSLSFGNPTTTPLTSQMSSTPTQDTNGDGVVDKNDIVFTDGTTSTSAADEDTVDSEDTSTSSAQDVPWWQKLLGLSKNTTSTSTNGSDSTDITDSVDDGSGVIGDDGADYDIADDGQSSDGVAGLENEDSIVDNSSTATANENTTSLGLTVASWNVYMFNKGDVVGNIKKVLDTVDILGLQEAGPFDNKIMSKIACSSCAYEMYPRSKGSPKKIAILWKKSKFTLLENGYKHVATQDGVKKYIVWVKLQEKTSRKVFYMLNTHLPFNSTDNGKLKNTSGGKAYKPHMEKLAAKVKELQKDQLPIFLTGDMNVDYRTDSCKTTALPCVALAKNLDVKSGWQYTKLKDVSKSTGTASSSRIIDYVFSWQKSNVHYLSMKIIRGGDGKGWGGSDHKPVALRLIISSQNNTSN